MDVGNGTGLSWLKGKRWAEVSRDERFFCAVLYEHARKDPAEFARWVIEKTGLDLATEGNWDLGYEVCFYRDYLWSIGKSINTFPVDDVEVKTFPPKRTFDLCLFSEGAIVIIEAKVCEPFDAGQNVDFARDKRLINKLPGLENLAVHIVALATSEYFINAGKHGRKGTLEVFENRHLTWSHITWAQVAEKYRRDDKDALLARADRMYRLAKGQLVKP